MNKNKNVKVIALYLPQFHPTPNNDIWWGKGFTEWTNVCKAKPLFRGHYQPRVPADLGFYDLRLPESRMAQANMAKQYGIEGFCYYHYWFGFGREELNLPFQEVLKTGEPDFPFMLCWANESWHAKFWSLEGETSKKMLVEQKYGDEDEIKSHFLSLLPAFKDLRYLRKDGKPMFLVYRPLDLPNATKFIDIWQELAKNNGLEGIYFIGQTTINVDAEIDQIKKLGFNAVNVVRYKDILRQRSFVKKLVSKIWRVITQTPLTLSYKKNYPKLIGKRDKEEDVIPSLFPNWDHTPRSGKGGHLLTNSTPELFKQHIEQAFEVLSEKKSQDPIIFLKSWNEWGEGNYIEPDLKYGHGYLEALKEVLTNYKNK